MVNNFTIDFFRYILIKHLLPASMWNTGILIVLADTTAKQLFVSPKLKKVHLVVRVIKRHMSSQ